LGEKMPDRNPTNIILINKISLQQILLNFTPVRQSGRVGKKGK
jgi:hypothetical protein